MKLTIGEVCVTILYRKFLWSKNFANCKIIYTWVWHAELYDSQNVKFLRHLQKILQYMVPLVPGVSRRRGVYMS